MNVDNAFGQIDDQIDELSASVNILSLLTMLLIASFCCFFLCTRLPSKCCRKQAREAPTPESKPVTEFLNLQETL